jgi:mutator protein MutT
MLVMKIGKDYIGIAVGVLILNGKGEVLLNKRTMNVRNAKGKWEAIGGGVDFGETREAAIKREVKEELGVEIKILKEFQTVDQILTDEKQHWISTCYIAEIKGKKEPEIREPKYTEEIGWFALDKLPRPLSPVTISTIKELKKQYKDMV